MMWPSFRSSRKNLFSMLRVLNIQSSTQNSQLIAAMKFIMQYQNTRTDLLPATINISFAPRKWQKMITITQGKNRFYSKKYLEVCVFTCLADELRAADVYVEGSGSWPDFRAELTKWKDCLPLIDEHCTNTGIPSTGKEAVVLLKDLLETRSREIDQRYPNIDELVIQEDGRPLLKKRKRAAIEEEDLQLVMMIKSRMPKRNLIDILVNIEHHAQWTSPFGPVSGSDAKIENPAERYILMTFAYGTGMGPKQTAQHMRHQISPHMLSWANQRHATLQIQNKAMAKLINLYRRLGITKCWGDGTRVAADGTLRKIRAENLTAEHHVRYGSTGGIAYHHVADNYIALFSTFIPCGVWEAVEIIEGLLRNESDVQPKIVHADTQGQSSVVFALAWLFGIKLMPRIRNWKDLKFYRPSKKTRYTHIDSLFSDSINWQLIETHWQDIMQVVISIRQGKISSSALLKKFGSYSRQNRLCVAMRELGNVIRTIFLLEYISDADVREEITAQTNKVESYNEFSGWISFGNWHAIVASNDPEEHEKAVKYNDIIANAIMLQNAIDMSVVVKELVAEGYPVKRTAMRLTSPYLTDHLNRFGEFVVDMGIATEDIQSVMDLPELE
ncbi:MAG TPA: transposase [Gammaproteobacteria bacterium]|nr:transposase [Gammaproteobacteria bacterium]